MVPFDYQENPSLGRWVSKQRTQYRLMEQGKPSQLIKERVELLNKLNFEWHANEAKWMAKYVEMEDYLALNDGKLPTHRQDQSLRRWIEKQRKTVENNVPPNRRAFLEKIGYPWPNDRGNLNNKPARDADLGEAETTGFDGVASAAGEAMPMSVTAGTSGQEANGLLALFSGNESTDAATQEQPYPFDHVSSTIAI